MAKGFLDYQRQHPYTHDHQYSYDPWFRQRSQ